MDADVFVLPSHQEGFSMAITEALGAGCVPVVTEECNFDELEGDQTNEKCGIIVRGVAGKGAGEMEAFTREVEARFKMRRDEVHWDKPGGNSSRAATPGKRSRRIWSGYTGG